MVKLFEILLIGGTLFTGSEVYAVSHFDSLVQEYTENLDRLAEEKFENEISSEELTGDVKLWLLESMDEMHIVESEIDNAIVKLQLAKKILKAVNLEYKYNGLDRIDRILQYRKMYRS